MKKEILITLTTVALIFSACGNNRGGDCDEMGGNLGSKVEYKNPTAIIDVNSTAHRKLNDGTYRADDNLSNPFILDAKRSHDNDENGKEIKQYDWNITSTFSDNCLKLDGINSPKVIITLCDEVFNDGDINATLTVTDDENKTDTTTQIIKIN